MADSTNPYEAVLADLRAKRAELDAAIVTIEKVMGIASAVGSASGSSTAIGVSGSVTEGMFFGMNLTEAARKYLHGVRKKQSAREIAEALERGGFHHQSKDFPNTVRAIMARNASNEGDFIRLQTDWGLAEWFPGRRTSKGAKKEEAPGAAAEPAAGPADDDDAIAAMMAEEDAERAE